MPCRHADWGGWNGAGLPSGLPGGRETIFFGSDLVVVHAAEAPRVSDPTPMGLTAMEVREIADVAASVPRTRVTEVTELDPVHDPGNATARLTASIFGRTLAGSLNRKGRAG